MHFFGLWYNLDALSLSYHQSIMSEMFREEPFV